ncbi:MAG: hypothetical protein IKY21_00805 [Clostridia bacterium]|nr:hypothetical protein [Clostridia bacterium]
MKKLPLKLPFKTFQNKKTKGLRLKSLFCVELIDFSKNGVFGDEKFLPSLWGPRKRLSISGLLKKAEKA